MGSRRCRPANHPAAQRTILPVSESAYYCAPQVFYFTPHRKWYLVYQMGVPDSKKMWVAHSTTDDIADPTSWTPARLRFIFQGMWDKDKSGKGYGRFQWRIGMLMPDGREP